MNLWKKKRYKDVFMSDMPNSDLVEDGVYKLTATIQRKYGFVQNRDMVYLVYSDQKIVVRVSMHTDRKDTKQRIVFWPKRNKKLQGYVSKKHKPNKYRVPKRTSNDVLRKY